MDPELSSERVADLLVGQVPEFDPLLREHLDSNGEVLQHVLFGDLTRFVLEAHRQGREELVERCLAFLSVALHASDVRVGELVAVSFVENVGPWDPGVADFIASWPDALRAEAERQGWRPLG
ncbi:MULTISPECIES: DUF7674 family protein [unclassified Nonomuraea]|uniref:DUF7674 family protein n=1 Tax=unclassified Nonomuraea TaxID=2593643 RepID=UPI0035BF5001